MSWGVNLAMAGAAARGMRQAQDDQADLEFTEKTRDYHLKNLASNEAMRPEREAEERGRLAYNTELYKGQGANLPAQQENKALELGVNSAKLRVESAEMERRTKVQEAERAATMSAFSEGQRQGLKPDQMMPLLLDHLQRAAVANNDPVRVQQLAELMNSEKANTAWRFLQDTVRAQLIGDHAALATSATNLYNALNPDTPGSLEPIAQGAVGGSPAPAPSGFRLKMQQPDGQVIEKTLTPEQTQQLVLGYINSVSGNFAGALEGQRRMDEKRAEAEIKGEQDRKTAAFKGENFVKVKTGENQEALFNTQTGQMIGGGAGPGAGEPSLTPKEVDQVRQAAEAVLKANQMAVMTEEGQKMLAQVTGKAGAYMRMGVLDEYGQRLDANSAVSLAWRVAKGLVDEAKLQRGAPAGGASFGANQSPAPSAATPAAAGSAQPNPNEWAKDSAGNYWKIDPATGGPAKGPDGKLIAWQAGGSATAATPATPATVPATPGVEARPANTTTAAGQGTPLPAVLPVPATTPPTVAAPAPDKARADLVAQAKELDRNIVLLRTQVENGRPGLNVAGAKKALASFEQRRAALGISPEEVATVGETSRVREESEAKSRAARVRATIAPVSPDRAGAKPAREIDVPPADLVPRVPAASTAPTPAAPAATAPAPARPRPSAPAARGVNALDPTAFSPNMGTQVMPAAAGAPASAPPPAAPAPRKSEGRKPAPARPVAEGANEFERTKGYGVRGKGTPDKGQDTAGTKPTQGMPQLPKPDSVTSMGDESAPNHIVNVRRQVAAQAQERLQRADLAFFEKYAQFLQPEERSRWVKALNERIAKDGMSGLVPKTRKYVVGPDGNLMQVAN